MNRKSLIKLGMLSFMTANAVLAATNQNIVEAIGNTTSVTHIGTYDGSTTFTTSSANGVNPGLFIEVMDKNGNVAQYESEDGMITIPNTREGAYVTEAKLLGKTMYYDLDTGELLDNWEEGRNLELKSVESPALNISNGKNLWFYQEHYPMEWIQYVSDFIEVIPGETLYFSGSHDYNHIVMYNSDKELLGEKQVLGHTIGSNSTYTVEEGVRYIKIKGYKGFINTLMVNRGNDYLPYEEGKPLKSSFLTLDGDITLGNIGVVEDELDLITGEVTKRLGQYTLIGSSEENWGNRWGGSAGFSSYPLNNTTTLIPDIKKNSQVFTTNNFPTRQSWGGDIEGLANTDHHKLVITVKDNTIGSATSNDITKLKEWLSNNPITVQYELAQEVNKRVSLKNNEYFAPETSTQLSIKGETVPLIASITVPTETLSFVIDPNQETDQQFIAPEFSVTNDTYAPLKLEIKTFTQLTNGMNDVLPSKHSNWATLGKKESNDIALAVVPKAGAGWKSLTEGERYVADKSNYELGVINPAETVEFSFGALHGPTITKPINLQYTLGLIFDFE